MRLSARLVAVTIAAAVVLSPLGRDPSSDSYPLSTYPMFATDRGAEHTLVTVVTVDADGATSRLSPELIAGTDEVVLASATVVRAVRDGAAGVLCEEVAARIGPGRTVRVQSERLDVVAFVADGRPPSAIDIHAECNDG